MTETDLEQLDWQELKSSQLVRVAHVEAENPILAEWDWEGTGDQLVVQFKSAPGKPPSYYRYLGATQAAYENLVHAESPGRMLNLAVKGVYDYRKIELEPEEPESESV